MLRSGGAATELFNGSSGPGLDGERMGPGFRGPGWALASGWWQALVQAGDRIRSVSSRDEQASINNQFVWAVIVSAITTTTMLPPGKLAGFPGLCFLQDQEE